MLEHAEGTLLVRLGYPADQVLGQAAVRIAVTSTGSTVQFR